MSEPPFPRRLLVFAPSVDGGIPHYTHHQAQELARRGVDVVVLTGKHNPWRQTNYRQVRALTAVGPGSSILNKALRVINHVWIHYQLFWWILRLRPSAVLFEANTEFYAALWSWPHLLLNRLGLTYVMTLHDPVRGLWFGPKWFSRLSLWSAYRLLRGGLIHGDPPKGAYLPPWLQVESVPHGLFDHMAAASAPYDLRERLGIAREAFVVLSFGHIADRKNQHLLVEAVARIPGAALVIAGPQMSRRNRPPQFYRDQAASLGCADRVHVIDRFIPDEEAAAFFAACDIVALTYDSGFVSQSGVIQIAAQWDRPVIASSGAGPLQETVEGNGIGIFVEPDSSEAIERGLRQLMTDKTDRSAGYAAFRQNASWEANVDGLLRLMDRVRRR
ncbi:glycosyltransferase family 4 protein [Novosphingobium sp. TH158]|uniref:glycosyltransferase family 4 protein n=1 Tax=Novosphingobium sp. TH158 TaxID=2067455 RepID=UPI00130471B9|nr:glycosyltransferase family 4 protein [Novosphingobium sp. TH158]